jgi:hypothetical protein
MTKMLTKNLKRVKKLDLKLEILPKIKKKKFKRKRKVIGK